MQSNTRPHHAKARDKFLAHYAHRIKYASPPQCTLVWVAGLDGKNFSTDLLMPFLGIDEISDGPHKGLVWWPFDEEKYK